MAKTRMAAKEATGRRVAKRELINTSILYGAALLDGSRNQTTWAHRWLRIAGQRPRRSQDEDEARTRGARESVKRLTPLAAGEARRILPMLFDDAAQQEERRADGEQNESWPRRFADQHPRCYGVAEIADQDEAMRPNQNRASVLKDAEGWHSEPE